MPNGKLGDHPYTDIVIHKKDVYSPPIAALIREIDRLADEKTRNQVADLLFTKYNEYRNPDLAALEQELLKLRSHLLSDARDRGYEL